MLFSKAWFSDNDIELLFCPPPPFFGCHGGRSRSWKNLQCGTFYCHLQALDQAHPRQINHSVFHSTGRDFQTRCLWWRSSFGSPEVKHLNEVFNSFAQHLHCRKEEMSPVPQVEQFHIDCKEKCRFICYPCVKFRQSSQLMVAFQNVLSPLLTDLLGMPLVINYRPSHFIPLTTMWFVRQLFS